MVQTKSDNLGQKYIYKIDKRIVLLLLIDIVAPKTISIVLQLLMPNE